MTRMNVLAAVAFAASVLAAGAALLGGSPGATSAAEDASLQAALKALQTYDWSGDRAVLWPIERAVRAAAKDPSRRAAVESDLLGALKTTKTQAGRRFACEMISLIASDAAVDGLAALLADPESSHYAQLALVRLGTPKAAAALRGALAAAKGPVRVGLVDALGFVRDPLAAEKLIPLLADADPAVAQASAVALGRIGTPPAAQALQAWADRAPAGLRAAALLACLDAADRLLADGKPEDAAALYEILRQDSRPPHIRSAAMRGLLRSRPSEALSAFHAAVGCPDKAIRIEMLKTAPDLPGGGITQALARFLPKLPPDEQVLCLGALEHRGDPAARPAVLAQTTSADPAVRLAAFRAMGAVGGASDVPMLTDVAGRGGDPRESDAARAALARLGPAADEVLLAAAAGGKEPVKIEAIRALGARHTKAAAGPLVGELKSPSQAVRLAAIEALGAVGDAAQMPPLLDALKKASGDEERQAAEESLSRLGAAAGAAGAEHVLAAMKGADAAAKPGLLRLLALAPSPQGLQAVVAAVGDAAPEAQDEAVRSLSRWPDSSAIAPLRQVARSGKLNQQVLALRGLARLVQGAGLAPAERFRIVSELWPLATRAEEKKLLLGVLGGIPIPEAMNKVMECLSDKAIAADACASAVRLGNLLLKSDKALVESAMKQVLATTKDKTVRGLAERLLRGEPIEEGGEGEEIIN